MYVFISRSRTFYFILSKLVLLKLLLSKRNNFIFRLNVMEIKVRDKCISLYLWDDAKIFNFLFWSKSNRIYIFLKHWKKTICIIFIYPINFKLFLVFKKPVAMTSFFIFLASIKKEAYTIYIYPRCITIYIHLSA